MAVNYSSRGEAFKRHILHICDSNRRVGNDILLFDEYTLTHLMRKPLRTSFLVALNVLEGKGRVMVNSVEYEFEAPCLLIFLPGQVFRLTDKNDAQIKTRAMILSELFVNEFYSMSLRMNEIFATLLLNPIIMLDGHGQAYVDSYVKSCILTISDVGNPHRLDVVRHLTSALFYGAIIRICDRNEGKGNRVLQICGSFMSLLMSDFRKAHRLGYYSSELCISSRYLSVCVKSVTGKTPNYWIDFYLITEARRLLRETDMTIDMISDQLGFVSQSVFGKFFRRLSGKSPSDYRTEIFQIFL